jgi:hypothetical protein
MLAAIHQWPSSIEYVKDQSEYLCMRAIELDPLSICFIRNKKENYCLEAVKRDPFVISSIPTPSLETCLLALTNEQEQEKLKRVELYKKFKIVDNPSHEQTIKNLRSKIEVKNKMQSSFK